MKDLGENSFSAPFAFWEVAAGFSLGLLIGTLRLDKVDGQSPMRLAAGPASLLMGV